MTAFVSFAEFMKMGTDDEDMLNAIRSLAQSSRQRIIRIIAIRILVNHFDRDDKTLAIIKELAKSDQHEDVRIEARDALALGWKEDPAIQVFLDGL
jgi:glutamyl/glutaminyl-tRNA synthetase